MDNLRPSLSRLPSDISISPTGVFHVLGFTPAEGEAGTPISVRIHFHPGYSDALSVRLIVGHKAVHTTVREIKDAASYGSWQLDAIAPPFDSLQSTSTKVLLSVQALNEDHAILDTLTFGEFIYWSLGYFYPLVVYLIINPSTFRFFPSRRHRSLTCFRH